jgi:hypothetical protein
MAYEKFYTVREISMSFLWIGENLAFRNFFNMESCSTAPVNMHANHPNLRHLKEDDTPSLLEAKIRVSCRNFVENLRIGENFQLRNFLQVTYDPDNQPFWNVVFRYNILHSPIMKIPPLHLKLTIILQIIHHLEKSTYGQKIFNFFSGKFGSYVHCVQVHFQHSVQHRHTCSPRHN